MSSLGNMKKVIKVLLVIILLFTGSSVFADTTIHLKIETNLGSIFNDNINVPPCDSEGDGNMKATPYCALIKAGIPNDYSGLWVNSINNIINNDNNNGAYWMWLVNFNINPTGPYSLSSKQYTLEKNDSILFYYNTNPLDISINNENPKVGEIIKISVKELGLDSSWNPRWNNAIGGQVIINLNSYELDSSGTYSLQITDTSSITIKAHKNSFIDSKELTINPTNSPVETHSSSGGGGHISTPLPVVSKTVFDIKKAFDFLMSQQKENGSFGEDLYTDWVALALSTTQDYQEQKNKLIEYFKKLKTDNYQLTDYERHTMALMSLGVNPYNVNGKNYVQKIISSFDGKQFGNPNEDNDDIFALIVLQNAGYSKDKKIIQDTIDFILSKQKENGSWNNSIDITGAAIQSISIFAGENFLLRGVSQADEPRGSADVATPDSDLGKEEFSPAKIYNALLRTKEFLKQNQKDNGGFGNVSATAWAMEGILSLGEKPEDWVKNTNSPLDYLAGNQDKDGGIKNADLNSKIWETAYTLSALSGKSWNQIMGKFSKPTVETSTLKKIRIPTSSTKTLESVGKINPQELTASPINANTNSQEPEQIKQNWFRKLINVIFGF